MPSDLHERDVVIADPMLATGNSAVAAVDRLKEHSLVRSNSSACSLVRRNRRTARRAFRCADLHRRRRPGARRERLHPPGLGDAGRPHLRHQSRACAAPSGTFRPGTFGWRTVSRLDRRGFRLVSAVVLAWAMPTGRSCEPRSRIAEATVRSCREFRTDCRSPAPPVLSRREARGHVRKQVVFDLMRQISDSRWNSLPPVRFADPRICRKYHMPRDSFMVSSMENSGCRPGSGRRR